MKHRHKLAPAGRTRRFCCGSKASTVCQVPGCTFGLCRRHGEASDDKPWYRGYAAAVAAFIRQHDQVSAAKSVLSGDGITLVKLKRVGVEAFDMDQLRKMYRY